MTINKPHLCTVAEIWHPKYSDKWVDEPRVLISKFKVHHASPVIIVKFTKAKSLIGQRFAIRRADAQRCEVVTNGKIDCYAVPLSKLEGYETAEEVLQIIEEVFS